MKEKFKKYWYVFVIGICVVCFYLLFNRDSGEFEYEEIEESIGTELFDEDEKIEKYYVDIKGEVINPGVYEIESDKRIIDVIKEAGGLTKNADTSILNLSKKITDEMNIKIYSKAEVKKAKENVNKESEVIEIIKEIEKECVCPEVKENCSSKNDAVIEDDYKESTEEKKDNNIELDSESKTEDNKLINLNTASIKELMSIPNIGESKAKSIIEYREKNKFKKIEDILNISGIGESIFEKIKEYITV